MSCSRPRPSESRTYQPVRVGCPSLGGGGGGVELKNVGRRLRPGARPLVLACAGAPSRLAGCRALSPSRSFERAHAVLDLAPVVGVRQLFRYRRNAASASRSMRSRSADWPTLYKQLGPLAQQIRLAEVVPGVAVLAFFVAPPALLEQRARLAIGFLGRELRAVAVRRRSWSAARRRATLRVRGAALAAPIDSAAIQLHRTPELVRARMPERGSSLHHAHFQPAQFRGRAARLAA